MKNILLTGGSGFIGRNIIESKLAEKYKIYSPSHDELDVLKEKSVESFFRTNRIDIVIHAAVKPGHRNANDPTNLFYSNTRMFFNLERMEKYYEKMLVIGSGAKIEQGHKIGNDVTIHSASILGEYSVIEDKVWIGPNVIFYNDLHPPCPKYRECVGALVIKSNAKIGARSSIFPGVIIGKNSIVGANSVVTKDVLDDSVVMGSPAKVVKKVDELKCFKGFFKKPYEWEKELPNMG